MPKLSETLQFTVRQVTNGSVTYEPSLGRRVTGEYTYYSDKAKGDGYYLGHTGLHTVTYSPNTMIGSVIIQATLATEPTEADWFDVDSTYATFNDNPRDTKFFNFTGNYVWIRAKVVISRGNLAGILYNH